MSAGQSDWLLHHHQLTDLPNARSLNERATEMRRTGRTGLCVFYIDLDGFKSVNDRHGHHVGDDVLREVGARLRASTRSEDFLAHLHGDEFVLLAQGVGSDGEAQRVIERLQSSLAGPIAHAVGAISVTASVGYRFAADAGALEHALREADLNMAATKAARAMASGRTRSPAPPVTTTLRD